MSNDRLQAIRTTWHGPTNRTGSRIVARCDAGRLTAAYNHALNAVDNHRAAATALANRYGWLDNGWTLVGGSLPGDGMAWVMVEEGR